MAKLVLADLNKLIQLSLLQNQLDAAAMAQLCKGKWPELERLDLQCNLLDCSAMTPLAKGNWPHLSALQLQDNEIMASGVGLLAAGQWPLLSILVMEEGVVSKATSELLNLAPRLHWVQGQPFMMTPRIGTPLQLWPFLPFLQVASTTYESDFLQYMRS